MARPRAAMPQLSPGQATYVLQRLVADRRISPNDITRYVSAMQREIDDLESRLEALRQASNGVPGETGPRPARRRRISAEQKASRELQGKYLGLIRQIPASRRAQYQKIAKEKGREAAIKEMVTALGK
jgi:O6-methylguanine-DNA--protein-cysteine methyltransferase